METEQFDALMSQLADMQSRLGDLYTGQQYLLDALNHQSLVIWCFMGFVAACAVALILWGARK